MNEERFISLMRLQKILSDKGNAIENSKDEVERQTALEDAVTWVQLGKQMINNVNAIKDWEKTSAKNKALKASRMEFLIGEMEDAMERRMADK